MLENRDYMRGDPQPGDSFRFQWSATTVLMVVLVVVFALQCMDDVYFKTGAERWLALTGDGLKAGWVWQLLTFQFLHLKLWHLFFNLLGLWFFGRYVEHVLGRQRFLVAYFGAGVIGGLLQGALMLLFPVHFFPVALGASAGVSGVFALFAMLERESEVRWNFILPIRAMTLLGVYVCLELFFTLVPTPREACVAHAAHLGGLLAGIAWVRLGWHHDFVPLPWDGLFARWRQWRPLQARQRKRALVRAASLRGRPWRTTAGEDTDLAPDEFISQEVDPILDKISAHGLQSLTDRERQILQSARRKMEKK